MRIVETRNARFIENGEINGSKVLWNVKIKEIRMQVPLTSASSSKVRVPLDVSNNNEEKQHNNESMIQNELIVE